MSSCQYYHMLKQSPLAKDREETTIEEVAIWLDMNKQSSRSSLTKILKAIDKNYHDSIDRLDDMAIIPFQKILNNSLYGTIGTNSQSISLSASTPIGTPIMPLLRPSFPTLITMKYFSDNALYWLFKLFSETSAFDGAILDEKFIDFSKKMRDGHRSKSMAYRSLGSIRLPIPSKINQALYEVFAELVDILESKSEVNTASNE